MNFPNIEAERARTGKTKTAFAKELGVDLKTIYNWLNGVYPIPSTKIILMCRMFGCTADYLLGLVPRERDSASEAPTMEQVSA